MELALCIRQLLRDRYTLDDYIHNNDVSWDTIKRRLFISEHSYNPNIPDHLYKDAFTYYSNKNGLKIDSLKTLLSNGIYLLAQEFIESKANHRNIIKKGLFAEWQDLLTLCSPLLLQSAYIAGYTLVDTMSDSEYLKKYIKPNLRNTALPSIKINLPKKELSDLHIHLNGSTEVDILWQYCLNYPNDVRKEFEKASKKELIKEQIEQEGCITSNNLYHLLRTAIALRYFVVERLYDKSCDYPCRDRIDEFCLYTDRGIHPIERFIDRLNIHVDEFKQWEYESLMYIKVIRKFKNVGFSDDLLVKAFHYYLLILGAVNSLVVQQKHQTGFIQFQKLADNKFRERIEKEYKDRFAQLNGNDNNYLRILEGRFSPKSTPANIAKSLGCIMSGYNEVKNEFQLKLIAHFIKSKHNNDDCFRHEKLRSKIWQQAEAIISYNKLETYCVGSHIVKRKFIKISGIDAAASEFDAPPEVFAPVYRFLRRSGINNFTYHAGEDFSHIVSGIRAIYEAVEFLELKEYDRIGHATALGIDVKLWRKRVGNHIYIKQGEWLDNLVFYNKIYPDNLIIKAEINNLSKMVYEKEIAINDLICSWKLRKYNPEILLGYVDVDHYQRGEKEFSNKRPLPYAYKFYYSKEGIKKYNEIIVVDTTEIFTSIDIELLQQRVTEYLNRKKIIREALPTSNVRIGLYKQYNEHHLGKWLKDLESLEFIVIGSDDPGIFATNIYNEYAHIHESLNLQGAIPYLIDNSKKVIRK